MTGPTSTNGEEQQNGKSVPTMTIPKIGFSGWSWLERGVTSTPTVPNSGSSSAHSSIAPPRQEMSHKNKSFHLSNEVMGRSLRNTTNYNDKLYLLKHSDMLLIL